MEGIEYIKLPEIIQAAIRFMHLHIYDLVHHTMIDGDVNYIHLCDKIWVGKLERWNQRQIYQIGQKART